MNVELQNFEQERLFFREKVFFKLTSELTNNEKYSDK